MKEYRATCGYCGINFKATKSYSHHCSAKCRFLSRIDSSDPNKCWEYEGNRMTTGYGIIKVDGKQLKAHRFAFELFKGPIPNGKNICHRCDNPPCCNHDHLFIGTQKENIRDAIRKQRRAIGEHHGCAKLTDKEVFEIRKQRKEGMMLKVLASHFYMSLPAIKAICSNKTWRHLL